MTDATVVPLDFTAFDHGGPARRVPPGAVCGALVVALSSVVGMLVLHARPVARPVPLAAAVPAPVVPAASRAVAAADAYVALLDPAFSLGLAPVPLSRSVPLGSAFVSLQANAPVVVAQEAAAAQQAEVAAEDAVAPLPPTLPTPQVAEAIPFPPPRPPDLRAPVTVGPTPAPARQFAQRQNRTPRVPVAAVDNRSFFEKLFGAAQPSGAILAYAAPEDGAYGKAPPLASAPMVSPDRYTAVYDIAAHTVYMPNGTQLEAHSGLGDRLDDPRYVGERMRGPTPPHVYDLQPREQLFHGVRALRLNPVGGGHVFGRTGLLAHTYMLGPNGDSNGCVSFRNYTAFLQAYANGEVRRLAVVARRT